MAALQDPPAKQCVCGAFVRLDQPLAGQGKLEQGAVIVLGRKWRPHGRHGIALHRAETDTMAMRLPKTMTNNIVANPILGLIPVLVLLLLLMLILILILSPDRIRWGAALVEIFCVVEGVVAPRVESP